MKDDEIRILILEDNPTDAELVEHELRKGGIVFQSKRVETRDDFICQIEEFTPQIILADYKLPAFNGMEAFTIIKEKGLEVPFIIVSGTLGEDLAVETLKAGVTDYILKSNLNRLVPAVNRALADTKLQTERRQAEEALRESEEHYRILFEQALEGICLADAETGLIIDCNQALTDLIGRERAELIGQSQTILHPPQEDKPAISLTFAQHLNDKQGQIIETQVVTRIGNIREVEIKANLLNLQGRKILQGVFRDITERKENELFQGITINILNILNHAPGGLSNTINVLLRTIKQRSGWDAVGIRLRGGDDFPYYLQNGFSEDFVLKENYLCSFAPDGTLRRDETGRPLLECTCGLVLSGRTDPANPMFTPGGSFWSNDMTSLLELPGDQDPRHYPRNQCIHAGYKSVALVPIRVGDEIVGLLQFNDRKTDCFTLKALRFYEGIATSFGIALARQQHEEALQQSEEKNRGLARANEIIASLGRIVTSTFDINQVFPTFFDQVQNLIPSDYLSIVVSNSLDKTVAIAYSAGINIPGRHQGAVLPFAGSLTEEVFRRQSSVIVTMQEEKIVAEQFPNFLVGFHAGLRTMLGTPLFSGNKMIGSLFFGSLTPKVYTEADLQIAERIGNQIAGAIANAQLFAQHERSEAEKTHLQSQLQQSQKMEAIGQLAGGVAHDFNNLLTVISVQSQLALRGLREGDPLKEKLKDIELAADRAANLTRQLLAFSRRQILEMKVINLNIIFTDMEKMLRRVIGEDIELKTILADDLGMVKVDPGQMEQVIVNLAVNAKDAMPQGGKLLLETANAELDEEYTRSHVGMMPGAYVLLSITDTGTGMTKEVKEQIFDPFFTTKEKGKGTGLGLSTVYGIVKQSGGDIYVYSEPNQGTTFKVYLPQVFEPQEEFKKATSEEIPRGKETILVVEDDRMVRRLAVDILRRQGYRVLEATEGGEALVMCEKEKDPIALILTDVVMPNIGGPELIERLKQVRKDFKVLYMTGYTDESIVQHGILEAGINLIHKPFTIDKLSRKVRGVLDNN